MVQDGVGVRPEGLALPTPRALSWVPNESRKPEFERDLPGHSEEVLVQVGRWNIFYLRVMAG